MTKRYFGELESIRGLAAFSVLLEHWVSFGRIKGPIFSWLTAATLDASGLAILTFFVLSGFVLTHVLNEDSNNDGAATLVARFWIRRIFRIYPLAILVVLAAFLFFGAIDYFVIDLSRWPKYNRFDLHTLVYNMLLMDSLLNTPGWTLKYEIVGYALIPFAFLTVSVKGAGKLIAFAILVAAYFYMSVQWASWLRLSSGFAAGFVAYYAYQEIKETRLSRWLAAGLFLVAVVALIIHMGQAQILDRAPTTTVGIAAVLLLLLSAPSSYSEVLRSGPLRWLGRVSYSVYLVHYPIMWTAASAVNYGHAVVSVWGWLAVGAVGVGGTFLLAPLSFRYIEAPGRVLGAVLANRVSRRSS